MLKRLLLLFVLLIPCAAAAQDLDSLEDRISAVEDDVRGAASQGALLFLFGAFSALWAQQTKRSAWLWFFLGVFFSVITVIVLLNKNANDRNTVSVQ